MRKFILRRIALMIYDTANKHHKMKIIKNPRNNYFDSTLQVTINNHERGKYV